MNIIRRSWLGVVLLGAGIAAAVTYWARRPDYVAVAVPELTLCQLFEYGTGHSLGDFKITDCKTGRQVGAFYVVDGRALRPDFVSWKYGGSEGDLIFTGSTAITLTGDLTTYVPVAKLPMYVGRP